MTAVVLPNVVALAGGDIVIDLDRIRVTQGGTEKHLTPSEFRLLVCLAENRGHVVSPVRLLVAARRRVYPAEIKTANEDVKVWVRRIRDKLGPDLIQNRRGFGYIVEAAS